MPKSNIKDYMTVFDVMGGDLNIFYRVSNNKIELICELVGTMGMKTVYIDIPTLRVSKNLGFTQQELKVVLNIVTPMLPSLIMLE